MKVFSLKCKEDVSFYLRIEGRLGSEGHFSVKGAKNGFFVKTHCYSTLEKLHPALQKYRRELRKYRRELDFLTVVFYTKIQP